MLKSVINREKLNELAIFAFVSVFTMNLFLNSFAVRSGICSGIKTCLNILIPALFPFVFITNFTVETNLVESIGKVLSAIFKMLYNLPQSAYAVVILALIGGYPAGAVGIKSLISQNKINKNQARQMAYFCVGSGPAYVINIVGMQIYNSFKLGLILLLAQVLSTILLGVISCKNLNPNYKEKNLQHIKNPKKISNTFVSSCQSAALSMGNICAFVILFSGIIFLINSSKILQPLYNLCSLFNLTKPFVFTCISSILEITNGTINFCNLNLYEAAFFLGFGGFCVHFQVISLLSNIDIKYIKFLFFRLLQGLIAAIFTWLLLKIFPTAAHTSVNINSCTAKTINDNFLGSIAIVLMSLILIISTSKNNGKKINNNCGDLYPFIIFINNKLWSAHINRESKIKEKT